MNELKRLVLDYRTGELVLRVLYRSQGDSNPGTKTRRREVTELTREDIVLCTAKGDARPDEHQTVWYSHHQGQAERLRWTLESLVSYHEASEAHAGFCRRGCGGADHGHQ